MFDLDQNSNERARFKMRRVAIGVVLIGLVGLACVFDEYAAYTSARERYEQCLEDNSGYPEACDPLKAEADRRFQDYEQAAGTVWGAEQTQPAPETPGLPN